MKKILIIGFGLIGGSLAKSLKKLDFIEQIAGFDINSQTLREAKKLDVIDKIFNFEQKLTNYDLIAVCSPLASYHDVFEKLSLSLISCEKKPIIIDLGSLKSFIQKEIPQNLTENFIACHPIAGSELSGFENSVDDLFYGKKFIICQNKPNKNEDIKKVVNLFKKIGCDIDFIDAVKHDEIYALVSHLPQFLSFLTKEFSPKNFENDMLKKNFRLDNSNEKIWGEIFALNEKNIEKFYVEFYENLLYFAQDLEEQKFDEIVQNIAKIAKTLPKNTKNLPKIAKNDKNITKILFRLIIVASYVKINDVKDYLNYTGSGFNDFSSIIFLLQNNNLSQLFEEFGDEILELIDKI